MAEGKSNIADIVNKEVKHVEGDEKKLFEQYEFWHDPENSSTHLQGRKNKHFGGFRGATGLADELYTSAVANIENNFEKHSSLVANAGSDAEKKNALDTVAIDALEALIYHPLKKIAEHDKTARGGKGEKSLAERHLRFYKEGFETGKFADKETGKDERMRRLKIAAREVYGLRDKEIDAYVATYKSGVASKDDFGVSEHIRRMRDGGQEYASALQQMGIQLQQGDAGSLREKLIGAKQLKVIEQIERDDITKENARRYFAHKTLDKTGHTHTSAKGLGKDYHEQFEIYTQARKFVSEGESTAGRMKKIGLEKYVPPE